MDTPELLAGVPLFRDLARSDLERVAGAMRLEDHEAETDIVAIGDPGHSLYVVVDGHVQVLYPARSSDFELARLGPGDFFGEMALLNDKPRSATVRSLERVTVLALSKGDFRRILRENPDVAVRLLETMSVRIRNADEQISGLSDKAMRDPLTSLLNRRAFHERLREEADRSRRYGDVFALIVADLDKFKSINDTFGHDAGDAILGWVGRLMVEHTRAADTPFRIGGEEFAILCPATAPRVAGMVSQRLVDVVGEARPPLDFDMRVTMSCGYAVCPEHGRHPDRLFQIADQALLRAKAEGRNRVAAPDVPVV